MLIVADPKLLLVDEPAAGLTDKETELTAELLLELKGRHTIIVIEHDMEFVRRLNRRVTVLDKGKVLADGTLDEVQNGPGGDRGVSGTDERDADDPQCCYDTRTTSPSPTAWCRPCATSP